MTVTLNTVPYTFHADTVPLEEVLKAARVPVPGIAVAVNNVVIQRRLWPETGLRDGDSVVIIRAVCGG